MKPIKTMGSSIESFEREGIEGLIDEDDPEMIIMGKELLEAAADHFGDNDLAVIFGLKDKRAEAERLESITIPTGNDCNGNLPSSDPFSKMTDTTSINPTKTEGLVTHGEPFSYPFPVHHFCKRYTSSCLSPVIEFAGRYPSVLLKCRS
jgi:hypothetical protein